MGASSRKVAVILAVSQTLFWAGYASYYVITRRLVEKQMGGDYSFGILLSGAEEAPLVASILLGYLADRFGRRRVLLAGLIEAALVALMSWAPLQLFPFLAAGAALAYALAYSSLLGIILAESYGSGIKYSIITSFGSLGWALGGLLGGFFYEAWGQVGLTASSILVAAAYMNVYIFYREKDDVDIAAPPARLVVEGLKSIWLLVVSISLGWAALTIYYGAVSIRLSQEVESDIAYGLALTTLPAIAGFLVRPLAGLAADRLGGERLLAIVNVAYGLVAFMTLPASGLYLLLLWVTPLYPFRDVASSISVSRRLPRSLQATAAGILSFTSSVAGFLGIASSLSLNPSFAEALALTAVLLLASNVALLLDLKPVREGARCGGGPRRQVKVKVPCSQS